MSHNPPFRADVVGSFLRTDAIHEARAAHEAGTLGDAELAAIEDREIAELIAKERATGLKVVTDGEFRREWWHYDFFDGLTNVAKVASDHSFPFHGAQPKPVDLAITGRIEWNPEHPFLAHARYVLEHADGGTVKFTIPAPTVLYWRLERNSIRTPVYERAEDILVDAIVAYQQAVKAFYDLGIRYLQFDDTAWAYLCSDLELERGRERGINTDGVADRFAAVLNAVLATKPADMTITTHVCRGNFRSTWIASGGYEPVAKQMLADTAYDGYFLEYDTDRAGGFEPLRFLPKGDKTVVLGLVTSKTGDLESREDIKARIAEAAAFAPLEQLALSPQCGFASTEEGNVLTEEQQWAKVREIVAIAGEVWGD